LKKLNYPLDKIEIVKKCILHHRGSVDHERSGLEEQIIAEADALSNFDNIAGIFKAAYEYENLSQGDARNSCLHKLENKWKQLHFAESKKIILPKYKAAKLLLSGK